MEKTFIIPDDMKCIWDEIFCRKSRTDVCWFTESLMSSVDASYFTILDMHCMNMYPEDKKGNDTSFNINTTQVGLISRQASKNSSELNIFSFHCVAFCCHFG